MSPLRRRSNGKAVSSTTLLVAAAPDAANPPAIHSQRSSPVTSSALMMTTRSTLSFSNQSSATPKAAVADAHARLIVVLGPRIPVYWANCECPMLRAWKRYRRSNRPSPSSPLVFACFEAICKPGKHDEKTIPVRSRWICGTCQFRMSRSPPFPTCSTGVSGIPASRSASNPAATDN